MENQLNSTERDWVALHERLAKWPRRLTLMLIALAAICFLDAMSHFDYLMDKFVIGHEFLLAVEKSQGYEDVAKEVFEARRKCGQESVTVDAFDVRKLSWDLNRYLSRNLPRRQVKIGKLELESAGYILAFIIGPVALLVAVLVSIYTIRGIHVRLAKAAHAGGIVQQKLNSLFYERVTTSYGEGWKRHVWLPMVVILILAFMTPVCFLSVQWLAKADLKVVIDAQGKVSTREHKPQVIPMRFPGPEESPSSSELPLLAINAILVVVWLWALVVALGIPRTVRARGRGPEGQTG